MWTFGENFKFYPVQAAITSVIPLSRYGGDAIMGLVEFLCKEVSKLLIILQLVLERKGNLAILSSNFPSISLVKVS